MSADDVAGYFRELKLEQYVPAIIENDVTSAMLQDLIAHDGLEELGITSKLHQAKVRSHISSIAPGESNEVPGPSPAPPTPAPAPAVKDVTHERFTDAAALTGSPVAGFAELEMCSFEEAAERLPIANVPGVIRECTALVETQVANGEISSSLSPSKAKALALYTHSDPVHESDSYYAKVNRALRKEERAGMTQYMRMLKLTVSAMTTITPYSGVLWRGVKADLVEMYPKGKRITWWSFSSCTVTLSVLERDMYLGKVGSRTLFNILTHHGYNIKSFSFFADEDEILLPPGLSFEVVDVLDMGNGAHIVQLREVESPECLLFHVPTTNEIALPAPPDEPARQEEPSKPTSTKITDLTGTWQQHTMPSREPPCYFIFDLGMCDEVPKFAQNSMELDAGEWTGYRGSGYFDPQPGFGFTEALPFQVDAWVQSRKLTYTIYWGGRSTPYASSSTMQFSLPLGRKTKGRFTNWHGLPGNKVRGTGDAFFSKV